MLSMILAHDLPCYRTVIKMVSGALLEGGISKYHEFIKKKNPLKNICFPGSIILVVLNAGLQLVSLYSLMSISQEIDSSQLA